MVLGVPSLPNRPPEVICGGVSQKMSMTPIQSWMHYSIGGTDMFASHDGDDGDRNRRICGAFGAVFRIRQVAPMVVVSGNQSALPEFARTAHTIQSGD